MTTTTTIPATPAKLRDGSWGARVTVPVTVGDVLTIRTQAGKTWAARVTCIVWTGEGVTLCATASLDRAPVPRRGSTYDPNRFNGYGARRGGYVRDCKTGGNCSSFGSGKSCGAHDCDGF